MEPLLETIDLVPDEANELLFKVRIEGTDPAPARIRLHCEGPDGIGLTFAGQPTGADDLVQFVLPPIGDRLPEGTYSARLEVIVENRYFSPVQFRLNVTRPVTVVAEAVQLPSRRPVPKVSVSAAPAAPTLREAFGSRPWPKPATSPVPDDGASPAVRGFMRAMARNKKAGG